MAVFRVERNSGYTVMSNHHLRNKELTLKAKGLLSQMLSLPEDWDYPDMTCFLALRNIERNERKERRYRMKENWIYRRGDVYLANLDPYIGSEQGGTRPVVVLQNNTGNYYCPTLIVAPITSKAGKKPSQPTHYYAERIRGLELPGMVLLEQIKTIDKRRVKKYLGRMTRQQMDEIGEAIESALGLYVPEEMEAP